MNCIMTLLLRGYESPYNPDVIRIFDDISLVYECIGPMTCFDDDNNISTEQIATLIITVKRVLFVLCSCGTYNNEKKQS